MGISPYDFCGAPVSDCSDYYVDFGADGIKGNKIIYSDLDTVILHAEMDPLFNGQTRILSSTCGCRDDGVCVASVKDGRLIPVNVKGGDESGV